MGIDPPERMYTVLLPKTSVIASAQVRMKRLFASVIDGAAE